MASDGSGPQGRRGRSPCGSTALQGDRSARLGDLWRAWGPALEHFGYGPQPGIDADTRGTTGAEFSAVLRSYLGDDVDAEAFWTYFSGVANESFARRIDKKPGLDDLLALLDERGIPRAVASSSSPEQIAHHIRVTGVERYFTMTVSGKEVAHTKPEPDIFLECARRMRSA